MFFCISGFRGATQVTPIHNHPDGKKQATNDNPTTEVLVECASFVVEGTVSERSYEILPDGTAQKRSKEHRDVHSWRIVDNPGPNHPHSIKNIGATDAFTLHFYTMDGMSEGQTVAVQGRFPPARNAVDPVYEAYDAFIGSIRHAPCAADDREAETVPQISAVDLLVSLKSGAADPVGHQIANAGRKPVVIDIRESKELVKQGLLEVEDAVNLHVPRGVAIARILRDHPDPAEAPLVYLCSGDGARSALLARELQRLGYAATSISDGIEGCAAKGIVRQFDPDSEAQTALVGAWSRELDLAPRARLAGRIAALKREIAAVTSQVLAERIEGQSADVVVIDVRQEQEQREGVIPDAQRVGAGVLEKKVRFHAGDLDTPLVICSGADGDYRALHAAKNLKEMGYTNVSYLEGGYVAYMKHRSSTGL